MTEQVNDHWPRWIKAMKILAVDPKAAVSCPVCNKGTLQVTDVRFDAEKIDRYMQCPLCHARSVMTLADPNQSGERQDAAESQKG
jgi:transcription elongation factor Elf1